ncbi:hypothetical protein NA66_104227 [Burkholderia pyrrocinia]|uniref:Uncharacterized protein n=1 Tax=Burkholderia pyrrocinia TaxID=60550 RepID=A0A318HUU3_BURPY|nr:hypothetical protein NA66_104227 [Burkholderia pyrrocinia]SFW89558.1 hypothetical protein SAMN03159384_06829 [Burkholderia sp. NFACC33-1]SFY46319.1 hypothetical protein SAMN03159408_06854 [Burkholderia sp. NFPP32]
MHVRSRQVCNTTRCSCQSPPAISTVSPTALSRGLAAASRIRCPPGDADTRSAPVLARPHAVRHAFLVLLQEPIRWPPAAARTGYLVADIETFMKVAREHGADGGGVDMFPDPIGRARVDFRRARTRGHTRRARCRRAARNTRSSIDRISNPQTLFRSVRPACLRASNGRHPGDRIQNLSSHPWDLSTSAAPNSCPDSPR